MKTRSRLRSVLYSAATVLVAAAVLEIGASWLMLVYYRATHQQNFETYDTSYLSVVNLARRFSRLVGLSEPAMVLEQTSPSPFFRADPLLGYSAAPGVYTHSYARRNGSGEWEYFRNKVTINSDGSRWVGAPRLGKPTVYIFGDSWVFGNGVPDEMIERIYEAFYSTKSEGMGIGLKLCRSIVESHHGRMQVENLYNGEDVVGCCFSFWIPVQSRLTPDTGPQASDATSLTDTERAR